MQRFAPGCVAERGFLVGRRSVALVVSNGGAKRQAASGNGVADPSEANDAHRGASHLLAHPAGVNARERGVARTCAPHGARGHALHHPSFSVRGSKGGEAPSHPQLLTGLPSGLAPARACNNLTPFPSRPRCPERVDAHTLARCRTHGHRLPPPCVRAQEGGPVPFLQLQLSARWGCSREGRPAPCMLPRRCAAQTSRLRKEREGRGERRRSLSTRCAQGSNRRKLSVGSRRSRRQSSRRP